MTREQMEEVAFEVQDELDATGLADGLRLQFAIRVAERCIEITMLELDDDGARFI